MIKELKPSKKRTEEDRSRLMATVGDIIADVRMNGDAALMEYNRRFDGCERTALRISEQEIRDAYDKVSAQEIEDIKKALQGKVYNLQGQYVGSSPKGLSKGVYMINGKKVIIK